MKGNPRIIAALNERLSEELTAINQYVVPTAMLENDRAAEADAVSKYNESVLLAVELKDEGSRALFEEHLKSEEDHLLWSEQQLDQIAQIGIDNYLANQVAGG